MPQRKKKARADYRLLIAPHFNERLHNITTLVRLETAQSFASFRYELSVEETLEKSLIHLRVLGLKAPQMSLPASGHASFVREYEGLRGTYDILVEGIDGSKTTCSIAIAQGRVQLQKPPSSPHVTVTVAPLHPSRSNAT